MTDEEVAELAQLSRAKQKAREDRAALIAGLKDSLQSQGITIAELFSAAEIAAALPRTGSTKRASAPRPQRAQTPEKAGDVAGNWVRQKQGLVLVEIRMPGLQGLPSRYCQGQRMAYYVPKALKALDDGQLEANLDRYTTEAGRTYFATEAGSAERAQLLNYIRTRPLKPR